MDGCTRCALVPAWILQAHTRAYRDAATVTLEYRYRNGALSGSLEHRPLGPPADEPPLAQPALMPPCPQCAGPLQPVDVGHRVRCERCDLTWSLHEYVRLLRRLLAGERPMALTGRA